MAIFIMEYRRNGYTIADALRPVPKWGTRTFFVDSKDIGSDDLDAVRKAAEETAPDGYYLFSIHDRDEPKTRWCGGLR